MEKWEKLINNNYIDTPKSLYPKMITIGTIGHVDTGRITLTAAIEHLMKSDKTTLVISGSNEDMITNSILPYQEPFVISARSELAQLSDNLGTYKDGQANRRERRKQQRKNGKR